jgi:hypothetical protein
MCGFTKFDPRAFLASEAPSPSPAKAAKLAKVFEEPDQSLATFATLAGHRAGSQNPAGLAGEGASAELLAPLFKPMSAADGEPSLSEPCAARVGRVEDRLDGRFLHFCTECGAWGSFGYGVSLRAGQLGRWYCAAHRPQEGVREPRP